MNGLVTLAVSVALVILCALVIVVGLDALEARW